jgi:hypothetical protein
MDTKGSIKAVLSTLLAEGKDRPVIINIGDNSSEVETTTDAASLAKELKSDKGLTKTKKVEKEHDKAKLKQRSWDNKIADLKNEENRVEIVRLRVLKLVNENKTIKELEELRKELL